MAATIDDYLETYQQACTAYAEQDYEFAATLVDQVVENVPDDPNCHLLRGHVYYVLQQYDIAKAEYQQVLQLTDEPEIISFAKNGLENIHQYLQPLEEAIPLEIDQSINFASIADSSELDTADLQDLGAFANLDSQSFDLSSFEESQSSLNPFDVPTDSIVMNKTVEESPSLMADPFAVNQDENSSDLHSNPQEEIALDLPAFWQEDISGINLDDSGITNSPFDSGTTSSQASSPFDSNSVDSPFAPVDLLTSNILDTSSEPLLTEQYAEPNIASFDLKMGILDETLPKSPEDILNVDAKTNQDNVFAAKPSNWLEKIEFPDNSETTNSSVNDDFSLQNSPLKAGTTLDTNSFDGDDNFDFEAFESAFGSDEFKTDEDTNGLLSSENSKSNIEFLDDFDEFDDLGNIPGFDLADSDVSFGDVALSGPLEAHSSPRSKFTETAVNNVNNGSSDRDEELFTITGSQEAVPIFTQTDVSKLEPVASVEQGWLAPLENASLDMKPFLVAGTVGIFSAMVVAIVSFGATSFSPPQQRESIRNTGWAMSLAAGISGFATAAFMGNLTLKQIRRTTKDLQNQFDAVRQGNLNVQATVYSEDELGLLSTGFNEMARVIFTTTNEAQRKADEQEEAKENLQRQVIRLLDDVEGAARGDLTVQAEVTADVLGAVADAFNLTIQNLRDIVQQVKVAAREVTKGATNSETFARALSSDALRQAEELAVTLNSVQVMTDSIQRVAEAAREAETVARDASSIALKGGEAVENTVAGILEIRETVAETTRKVKRLAESSQEISKIVALISQIASRTNLLALNASIEAARAGEAGRGFAIVADEVRQLADKSAKSLKEIEQIVMQIQSETGSVMTAMEEGTQQVIKGTKLAEEAKRSLENIIQVANRIDILVRSITSDTVEQTETSRAVAQVMQSVELTAQETSQEAQRVSGALQNLVGVSRDLIASVERFRVDTLESK
ncbi:methyl-accepting chemotaxis sensory transducer [Anabaenopsis circularis NIES-21]|uniref:Methyl-accepting chemotaxis sensory transducer n=2 Tax=Nostocales TaxID=1161 RepID=A0A1Z4GPE5_9CYAN|nr:methyl-accepting chemotaxis protein [Nostoc cycadae]BAY19392.1 methyl-accepting chemotaxis sensory transducer [Anabaenopsis circularis NIES-21]GBE93561.1 methyl-accepting chemotaxis sensory transducer [Nostoc cycadae WK-1]